MWKKVLTLALAWALVYAQGAPRVLAATQAERDAATLADVKAKIQRAGTGGAARVTVWLKDGATRKGYVSEVRDAEFVLRDATTDAPTVVAYADAARVEINRGHSTFRKYAISTGVTFGVLLLVSIIAVETGGD
ncbi:MAG: hypothetical protein QOF61_2479 [Acidobacteriota bacterium]|jgi:hypothetical protein|nr:hypothetical protein [Acidobacteriota bacterium]